MTTRRPAIAAAALLLTAVAIGACGDDDTDVNLSAEAADGRRIFNSNGCAACHGSDGGGGLGPGLVGLFGSEQALEDGATVVADEAYITESIKDPGAKIVAGYSQRMPENNLGEDEIAEVVQYIRELATPASSGPDATESP